MYLLVNLLIKLSMLQCTQLEIHSRPLGWRAAPVKNHWYILYSRGGQTCSTHEPHIVKSKLQKATIKKLKTLIYLLSTLLWHQTVLGTTCKSNTVWHASYHSIILQYFVHFAVEIKNRYIIFREAQRAACGGSW